MTLEMILEIAGKTHIPRQLSQIFRLHFFGICTMITSVHSSGNATLNQASSNMGCSTCSCHARVRFVELCWYSINFCCFARGKRLSTVSKCSLYLFSFSSSVDKMFPLKSRAGGSSLNQASSNMEVALQLPCKG